MKLFFNPVWSENSGTVRSKQLWGKPCLFAGKDICCPMSENAHSAPGSLCLLAAGLTSPVPQGERITSENKANAVRRSRMTRRTLYYCHGWHTNQRVEKWNTCKWRKRRQLAFIVCLKIVKAHKYEFSLTLEQTEVDFLCALRQYLCLSCTSKQKSWHIRKYTLNADNNLLQHVSSSAKCSWSHSFSGADKNKNIPTCYVCWYATWNKSAEW